MIRHMAIETPCSVAQPCSEDHLGDPHHDELEDHNEFVPHVEDWFRDPGAGRRTPDGRRRRRALERCWNECPSRVRLGCLEAGLDMGLESQHGIWGGHTEAQRTQILLARQWRSWGHTQLCISTALAGDLTVDDVHDAGGVADCPGGVE
jgi:hypothetical protein